MRSSILTGLLAAAASSVHAFSDSSPFIAFSTFEFATSPEDGDQQLQSSSQVLASVKDLLSSCATDRYLLVSQPNMHAADLRGPSGCRAPNLCRALEGGDVRGRFSVAEVVGGSNLSFDDFADHIRAACLGKGRQATVETHELPSLPTAQGREKRLEVLGDNDHALGQLLQKTAAAAADGGYTVIYFSNPNEFRPYEAEFDDPVRMELKKRQVASPPASSRFVERRQSNVSDNRPLFEKYQFFSPAIFMGLVALLVLLSILYVGLSALSSLEVSYGAFDKEMGPAAQKKQM